MKGWSRGGEGGTVVGLLEGFRDGEDKVACGGRRGEERRGRGREKEGKREGGKGRWRKMEGVRGCGTFFERGVALSGNFRFPFPGPGFVSVVMV